MRAGELLRERGPGLCAAMRALFALGVHVSDDFLENNVDLGASLVALTGELTQAQKGTPVWQRIRSQ